MNKTLSRFYATIYHISLSLLMFTICRFIFFLFYYQTFSDLSFSELSTAFIGGIRFDLTAVLYINLLFMVLRLAPFKVCYTPRYKTFTDIVFITVNAIVIIANLADMIYFQYSNSRLRFSFFSSFLDDTGASKILLSYIIPYWYVLLLSGLLILLLTFLYKRVVIKPYKPLIGNKAKLILVLQLILFAGVFIIGVRGGITSGSRPLDIGDAIFYAKNNKDVNLVLNSTFTVLRSIGSKNKSINYAYLPPSEREKYYTSLKNDNKDTLSQMNKKNIFIIVLEGVGNLYINSINPPLVKEPHYKGYMPFLDSLITKSLVFTNHHSTGGGSINGINAIAGSFSAFNELYYMKSAFSHNKVDALASLLSEEGYYTSFYCGCNKGSYSFETFTKSMGYHHFCGREEYNNDADYDGSWGIFDDKMGKHILKESATLPTPFLNMWFTISSHAPCTLPKWFKDKTGLPEGGLNNSVLYVNEVLKTFFEEAEKQDWYKNTLFVITSDHSNADKDFAVFNEPYKRYNCPLVLFSPEGDITPSRDTLPCKQNDIGPTILGYLNYTKPYISFGENILDTNAQRFAVNYVNNQYQIIKGDYLMQFDDVTNRSVALFNTCNDPALKVNIIDSSSLIVKEMTLLLQSYLDDYSFRINNNKMALSSTQK